ncbi:MAG: aminotransferase class V-fold PLP-dependent enzyme [Lachnospiraceae bacterium]|nr:aminotransferase class V-fold PLP-dependent enzyme [Lachnospiraceae bacterium]
MIYFDNAATTKYKPDSVYEAFMHYAKDIGVSPGRGSYSAGIEASRMLFNCRKVVGKYFGLGNNNVVFTKNSTEAINLFFNGFLCKGDHVIISCYEHNAVLRPLQLLKENGVIEYSVIDRDDLELSPNEILLKYKRENTKLLAITLASNLTGRKVFNEELIRCAKKQGIYTFVDSSQGAGKIPVSMKEQSIDYLAFTGHKDLLGLPGVGGLCCSEKGMVKPLIQGGTGVLGDSYTNPDVFPEGLEAGTLNMPAIWALKTAIEYCSDKRDEIVAKEKELTKYLIDKLKSIEEIIIYDEQYERVSTVGINVKGKASSKIVELLDENNICTRGGIHCAILAHEALFTKEVGVVRISLSANNTKEEIDTLIEVLEKCR